MFILVIFVEMTVSFVIDFYLWRWKWIEPLFDDSFSFSLLSNSNHLFIKFDYWKNTTINYVIINKSLLLFPPTPTSSLFFYIFLFFLPLVWIKEGEEKMMIKKRRDSHPWTTHFFIVNFSSYSLIIANRQIIWDEWKNNKKKIEK